MRLPEIAEGAGAYPAPPVDTPMIKENINKIMWPLPFKVTKRYCDRV